MASSKEDRFPNYIEVILIVALAVVMVQVAYSVGYKQGYKYANQDDSKISDDSVSIHESVKMNSILISNE